MIYRAGLIGDVHGQLAPLQAALSFLQAQKGLYVLLCTGDLPERGDPLLTEDSVTCCRLLKEAGVRTVRGNHDRWKIDTLKDESPRPLVPGWTEDEGFEFLAALPPTIELSTPLGPVMLCHGIGRDDMNGLYRGGEGWLHTAGLAKLDIFRNVYPHRLILCGHTHLRMVETFDDITVINAGALDGIKGDPPTVTLIDFEAREVQFFDIDGAGSVTLAETHLL
jgi:predicted phosphodiesterase